MTPLIMALLAGAAFVAAVVAAFFLGRGYERAYHSYLMKQASIAYAYVPGLYDKQSKPNLVPIKGGNDDKT
jgi:hypothetical protein